MEEISLKLTVFYEEPFWVGILERVSEGKLTVCKITFGAEPGDYDVWDIILNRYGLLRFSPPMAVAGSRDSAASHAFPCQEHSKNPKRISREVHRQLQEKGVGTKAQQALKLQHEQMKACRLVRSRDEREAEEERRFALRRQKKKEKHRGR